MIASNYFPSCVTVPEAGLMLHSRGAAFRAQSAPDHPNHPLPGKRPYHTIIPALVRAPGANHYGALGVVGGSMQPQGQVQVLHNLACGLEPQAALDAPRWSWRGDRNLALEFGLQAMAAELTGRGHRVTFPIDLGYGGGHLVIEKDGYWWGACDGRFDGIAAGV
jgi:gamma-glutamyltranspeptidase/glutathione hydrolase